MQELRASVGMSLGLGQVDGAGKRGKGLPLPGTKYGEHGVVAFFDKERKPMNSSYKQRNPQDLGVAGLM